MSEDQIRTELLTIRSMITDSQDKTMQEVSDKHDQLCKNVGNQLDTIKWMIGLLIIVLVAFGGWLAIDHLTLKQDHKDLKTDFGTVLMLTSPDNHQFLGYDELLNKYFPSRGGPVK